MWHVIEPDEKEEIMSVIDWHVRNFSVDLWKDLRCKCSIPFKDMHLMITCYHLANKFPIHLIMMAPTTNNEQKSDINEITMAKAELLGETSHLNLFLLKLDGLSGIKRFDHMVRKSLCDPKVIEHQPIYHL